MKKSDLVAHVAEKAEISKDAATRALQALFDGTTGAIAQAMQAGEQVTIAGFGRFRPRTRKARKGRNPQTGAEIEIPERNTVQFSAGKQLKTAVGENASGAARGRKPSPSGKSTGSAGARRGTGSAAAGKASSKAGGKGTTAAKSGATRRGGATGSGKAGGTAAGGSKSGTKGRGGSAGSRRGGEGR